MNFIVDDFPYYLEDCAKEIILAEDAPLYVFRRGNCTEQGFSTDMLGSYDFWEDAIYRIKQEWKADKKKAEAEGKKWDRRACLYKHLIYIRESDVFVIIGPKNRIYAIQPANFLRNEVGLRVPEFM